MLAEFRRLLAHARATKQLAPPERSGPYQSHENVGDRRYLRIAKVLDVTVIEEIMYRAKKAAFALPGRYKRWWARLDLAGMGDHLFGSGQRMLEIDDPGTWGDAFQVSTFDSTGIWNTRESMLVKLEQMLEHYAATPSTIVFLQGLSIRNYSGKVRV